MSFGDDGYDGFGGGGKRPEFPDPIKKIKEKFGNMSGGLLVTVVIIVGLVWAARGFYIVNPDEQGVVLRFGEYSRTTDPGPHWHLPVPIERVLKPKVTQIHRMEVGFQTIDPGPPARYRTVARESMMLTGDENIVSCEFIVQYQIKDALAFLFNVRDPVGRRGEGGFVKDAAEAAMREVVGRNNIDEVLTEAKDKIQIEARALLQEILDTNDVGNDVLQVKLQDVYPPDPVIAAFRDVASAREDRETVKNQAEAYANDVIPKARGEAEKRLNEAEAYKQTRIKTAEGDAARFLSLWNEYKVAKTVTRKRMYLESIGEVLKNARVVVAEGGGKSILPILPLGNLSGSQEVK